MNNKSIFLLLSLAQSVMCSGGGGPSGFTGNTPRGSFVQQSDDKNSGDYFDMSSKIGCYIGFIMFGIAYIYTIGYLFYDIRYEMLRYDREIENSK